ncbi:MAG: hypothetical protein AB8I08_23555 [Sandaracinaceae bacterium]
MMRHAAALLGMCLCLGGCGSSGPADAGSFDAGPPPIDGVARDGGAGTWSTVFEDDFSDTLSPPFVEDYEALPMALFADDGSRWTQIQNSHPGQNDLALMELEDAAFMTFLATGQADGVASKSDLGRGGDLVFGDGDVVRITAVMRLRGPTPFADNTLIDLEDTDDLFIDDENPGAGLRVRTNSEGQLALDRGEIPGSEDGVEAPEPRLSTLRSDFVLPTGEWFHLEVTLRLGTRVARSAAALSDFDETGSRAWVEMRVDGEQVLRMEGSNLLERGATDEVLARDAPELSVRWADDEIDYDSLQIGATNNRSGTDCRVDVASVVVQRRAE